MPSSNDLARASLISLEKTNGNGIVGFVGKFAAMASDCEILVDSEDETLSRNLTELVAKEAWRIERKFSRYRDDSVIHLINTSAGRAVDVDDETSRLLDFADYFYQASEFRFDITSGILRKIWTFDGGSVVPPRSAAKELLRNVGWNRVHWDGHTIKLPAGMELDFGGLGKEYAADNAARLVSDATNIPVLVNLGGDMFATVKPRTGRWLVGVEAVAPGKIATIELKKGGLATSGDARRFVRYKGRRLSHILNAQTGWPVSNAPKSVTVAAPTCIEAGMLATLAILKGKNAEAFIDAQQVVHFVQR